MDEEIKNDLWMLIFNIDHFLDEKHPIRTGTSYKRLKSKIKTSKDEKSKKI